MTFYPEKRPYSSFENNMGQADGLTDRRTDTTSYRDATAHLKTKTFKGEDVFGHPFRIKAEIRPFGKGEVAPSGLVGGRRFHVAIQIGEDARRLKRGGGGEMTW